MALDVRRRFVFDAAWQACLSKFQGANLWPTSSTSRLLPACQRRSQDWPTHSRAANSESRVTRAARGCADRGYMQHEMALDLQFSDA
jgi:hypothetical protein